LERKLTDPDLGQSVLQGLTEKLWTIDFCGFLAGRRASTRAEQGKHNESSDPRAANVSSDHSHGASTSALSLSFLRVSYLAMIVRPVLRIQA
jgi:hypothetical protein